MDPATAWSNHSDVYQATAAYSTTLYGIDAVKLASLPPAARCLDIACGTGSLAIHLARRGHNVVGTDFSSGMLDIARAASKSANLDITYQLANGQDLAPFADESFDAAISNFGIFMFPQRELGWKAAHRVLKPGGTLVATGWDATQPMLVALNAFRRKMDPNVVIEENPTASPENFAQEIRKNGFTDVKIYPITHEFVFESGKDFLRMLDDNPFFKKVVEADVGTARRVFLEAALGITIESDVDVLESPLFHNPVHFKAVANVCVARKPRRA
ncbi:hypothetical protein HDU86_002591 [Geranomyces michiganensis]|nr:hypothetical protein HDU86_002591 [Geranomyces michiganensis]